MGHFETIARYPDSVAVFSEQGEWVGQGGAAISACGADISFEHTEDGMAVRITGGAVPLYEVTLRWNFSMPAGARFLGDHWERGYGDLEWRGYVPERVMPWYFVAAAEGCTAGYGVKVRPDAMDWWQADPNGVTLHMDLRCGGAGVVLGGSCITAAVVQSGVWEGIDPYEAAENTASLLADGLLAPEKPIYGSNNWYYAYGESSHEEILADAAYLARMTEGLENRPFMVIDDCWQKLRRIKPTFIGGPWRVGNEKFPDMKRLADEISAMDLIPGIWWRPLQNRDEAIPAEWKLPGSDDILDPTVPEALEWIREDHRTLVNWGYRLIKHDYSTYDLTGFWGAQMGSRITAYPKRSFRDRSKTTAMAVKMLYQALYETKGEAMILGCNVVGHLAAGLVEANRTGDDTSGRIWEQTRQRGVNTLAFRMPQHKRFFEVDADCVGILGPVPWEKNRQWLHVLSRSGTPLFVSVKPGVLNAEQEEELKAAFACASKQENVTRPIDWMETTTPSRWLIDGAETVYNWYEDCGILRKF